MARYVGIDPSTQTGIVIIDEDGELWEATEIEKPGKDPERMSSLITGVHSYIRDKDIVAIEGFGFASQKGFISGGIGWGIRIELYRRGIKYIEVAPAALKKFASGKGNTKKDELAVSIFKKWQFEHKSDNVRDAYVLARIAKEVDESKKNRYIRMTPIYQGEVIETILNPPVKKTKKKKAV